jgi:chaperone required for assembly of F1-ATPase
LQSSYIITLDGKTIKTPYHNILAVPSSSMAFLIANEFNRQVQYLKTGEMPFLAMCRTAVDADIEGHLA